MHDFHIDNDLFRCIPAELMLRYGFVPHRREGQTSSSSSPIRRTCR